MIKFNKNTFISAVLIVVISGCSNKEKILEGSVNILSQSEEVLKVDSRLSDKFFGIIDSEKVSGNSTLAGSKGNISFAKIDAKKLQKDKKKYSKAKSKLPFFAEPLVIEQKLYILDVNGDVVAYDLAQDKVQWKSDLKVQIANINSLKGGVAYYKGNLYVINGSSNLYCLNENSGEVLWQKDLNFISRSVPLIEDNRVLISTINNKIIAFDALSGKKLWLSEFVDQISSLYGNSSFAAKDQVLAAGNNNGDVVVYDLTKGQIVWQDNIADINVNSESFNFNDIDADPIIYNNKLYMVSSDGYFVSYELLSGIRNWDIKISARKTPWVTKNLIFVIDNNNNLIALSTTSGKIKWLAKLEDFIKGDEDRFFYGPIVAGGHVLISTNKGKLLVFDFNNGELRKKIKIPKNINHKPVIANNQLYLINNKSKLYKLY